MKKLEIGKTRFRKSLITNGCILRFGAFWQFFHTSGGLVEGSRWSRLGGTTGQRALWRSHPGGVPENNVGITPRLRNLFLHEP